MRYLLVLAFVAVACAGTIVPGPIGRPMTTKIDQYAQDFLDNDSEIEVVMDHEDGTVEVAPQFIVSWQIRRFIRRMQKQMPCGWPQYGIPPLAPLKVSEGNVHLKKGLLETFDSVFRLRVDGLDDFKIKKFKLNMITSRITFDFLFKNVRTTAPQYSTDTILDAMRQLGLSVEYEGDGTLDFGLTNLRIAGKLKYKMPILWGSIKILSLKTTVSLGSCESDITGLVGDGAINHMINRQLENMVEMGINNNQQAISDKIEETIVPPINRMLKGNDFWTLLDYILSSSEGEKEDDPIVTKCVPPQDPWNP